MNTTKFRTGTVASSRSASARLTRHAALVATRAESPVRRARARAISGSEQLAQIYSWV